MADRKEVSILLLGIVAILAIVGLVLLFTSPAATGKAFFPPPLPPSIEAPAAVGPVVAPGGQYGPITTATLVTQLEGSNLARCPNGRLRTRIQGNIPYEAVPGHLCQWFHCPELANSPDPAAKPMLACVQV